MARTFYPKERRPDRLPKWKEYDLAFDLLNALALAKDATTVALLLRDLLTPKEVRNVAKRLQIAKMLMAGEKYDDIAEYLKCSLGTVAKVKIWLDSGGQGLQRILLKLPQRKEKPRPRGDLRYKFPKLLLYGAEEIIYRLEEKKLKAFLKQMGEKVVLDRNIT